MGKGKSKRNTTNSTAHVYAIHAQNNAEKSSKANNIFLGRKWDAFLYLIIYVAIPIGTAGLDLWEIESNTVSGLTLVNCYFVILVNAAGGFYDALARWDLKQKITNSKLTPIIIIDFLILLYCIIEIYAISQNNLLRRMDYFLLLYFMVVCVVLIDAVRCFIDEISWDPFSSRPFKF